MDNKIYYKKGYKYQLSKPYKSVVPIRPDERITTRFIELIPDYSPNGILCISVGYAWDGPSGLTIDTKNFMRGPLEHDAFYQLMRLGYLPQSARELADQRLHDVCRADGMSRLRAWYVLRAVRKFAGFAADPKNAKKEYVAP